MIIDLTKSELLLQCQALVIKENHPKNLVSVVVHPQTS